MLDRLHREPLATAMDERIIEAAVRSVLAEHGWRCRRIEIISGTGTGRKRSRCALRVELVDGTAVKVRCLENRDEASRLVDLRSRFPAFFAPVLVRYGAVLIESWIDGEELSLARAAVRAEEMGAILGRLHATECPKTDHVAAFHERCDRAMEQLGMLAASGVISRTVTEELRSDLLRSSPEATRQTIVHMDYCPENLVMDAAGGLHVIDNEWCRIDAPGFDLGRTYSRWPMTHDVWERFLRGYLTTASFDPGPLRAWMIVMATAGAVIRLHRSAAELALPLARLHELAGVSSGPGA